MAALNMFFIGLLLAGFFPPPYANLPQEEVVAIYQQGAMNIRLGMEFIMASCLFMPPFTAVIAIQMKRIEGVTPLMTYAQISSGTLAAMFFILPAMAFFGTAYQPDRPQEITYMMHQTSWILTIAAWPPAFIQNLTFAIAVFLDKSEKPIFPRWVAYFSVWMGILYIPSGLVPFFHTGPFTWSGILGFWLPVPMVGVWFGVMLVLLLKAIKRQAMEASQVPAN